MVTEPRELPSYRPYKPKRPARHDSDARKRQKVNDPSGPTLLGGLEPVEEQLEPIPVSDPSQDALGSARILDDVELGGGSIGNSEVRLATIRSLKTHHDLALMGSQGACQMIEALATMSCRLEKALRDEWAKSASLESREKKLKECQEALSKSEKKASDFEHKLNESQAERVSLTYELAKARGDADAKEKQLKECQEALSKSKEKAATLQHHGLQRRDYEGFQPSNESQSEAKGGGQTSHNSMLSEFSFADPINSEFSFPDYSACPIPPGWFALV